jgi:hypothetical protein
MERNPTCFLAHDLATSSQFLIIRFCRHSTVLSTTPTPRAARRFWPTACTRGKRRLSRCGTRRSHLGQGAATRTATTVAGTGASNAECINGGTDAGEEVFEHHLAMEGWRPRPPVLWMSRLVTYLVHRLLGHRGRPAAPGSMVHRKSSRFMVYSGLPSGVSTLANESP